MGVLYFLFQLFLQMADITIVINSILNSNKIKWEFEFIILTVNILNVERVEKVINNNTGVATLVTNK